MNNESNERNGYNAKKPKLTYHEQLRHPLWDRKRAEVKALQNYLCEECGSGEKQLHVHHSYYQTGLLAWEYPDFAYHCLCADCHEERAHYERLLLLSLGDAKIDAVRALAMIGIDLITAGKPWWHLGLAEWLRKQVWAFEASAINVLMNKGYYKRETVENLLKTPEWWPSELVNPKQEDL